MALLHCSRMQQVLTKSRRGFASDSNAGVHPEILQAILRANQGHVRAYGDDDYTRAAIAKFEEHFGSGIRCAYGDHVLYNQIIDAWSMRNWRPGEESGHDHFFATFDKFIPA